MGGATVQATQAHGAIAVPRWLLGMVERNVVQWTIFDASSAMGAKVALHNKFFVVDGHMKKQWPYDARFEPSKFAGNNIDDCFMTSDVPGDEFYSCRGFAQLAHAHSVAVYIKARQINVVVGHLHRKRRLQVN